MLIKLLGAIDFISGLFLIFGAGLQVPQILLFIFGGILILKSFLGMFKEIGSWIDLTCGAVFILLAFIQIPLWICVIVGVFLAQKGVFSFL